MVALHGGRDGDDSMVRRMNGTYRRAIELATRGVDLGSLGTQRHPLVEAAKTFSAAAERLGDKVMVTVSSV